MFPGTHAASAPDRPAVVLAGSGHTVTYGQLDDNSARLASALRGLGLRPGDMIVLVSDNSAEAFEIYWAAIRSGLYITAVNWHLAPEEAAYIVRDSGALVVISSAGVRELARIRSKPYPGKAITAAFLRAVLRVLDDFHYVRQIADSGGRDHAFIFQARIGDKQVSGCDFVHWDADGKIDEFTVMVRPLSAANALQEAMGAQMERIKREALEQRRCN